MLNVEEEGVVKSILPQTNKTKKQFYNLLLSITNSCFTALARQLLKGEWEDPLDPNKENSN